MTADEERIMREMKATISKLWREVAMWKDRYEALEQAYQADIKHFNKVYNCTGPL